MNSVILTGRLTKDPELRYTSGTQTAVATFTLAVNRVSRNDEADFIRIVVYGKQAENCSTYLRKGAMAGIEGRIQTGSYEKDGRRVYTTDVIANRVEFFPRSMNQGTSNPYAGSSERPSYSGGAGQNVPEPESAPDGFHAFDDEDDEENIPF